MFLMVGMIDKRLEVDSFYTMFTLRHVQKALGCSRATLYRTLKKAGIERYYIPNHPGPKYIWGCSLYKLLNTPIYMKYFRRSSFSDVLESNMSLKYAVELDVDYRIINAGIKSGIVPVENGEIPWWYINSIKGMLKLSLPHK